MNRVVKHKKCLLVFILVFLLFCSLFLCGVIRSEGFSLFFVFLCPFSFLIIFTLFVFLFLEIIKERQVFSEKEKELSEKARTCVDKMLKHYNVIEISKISFGIYHDLSNILTTFNLLLKHLDFAHQELGGGDEKTNPLQELNVVSSQAFSLVSFLKDQHQEKAVVSRFNVADEIERCLMIFNYYLVKHNIRVNLLLDNRLCLSFNQVKFSQLVINLLSNAIDSLKEKITGAKKIHISVFVKNNFIYLIFKDNGIGIDSGNLKSIFDPFFSLKTNKDSAHCGLGLFSCKKIIEDHFGGTIRVKSDIGRGAKFVIKIPLNSV